MIPAWAPPTARNLPWLSLGSTIVAGVVLGAVLPERAAAGPIGLVLAGAMAAGVVTLLDDPAASMLAALPTGRIVRALRAVTLLAPVVLGGWLLVRLRMPEVPTVASIGVLTLAALAVGLVADAGARHRGLVAGLLVALAWPAATWFAMANDMPSGLLAVWLTCPFGVLLAAGLLLVAGGAS